MLVTSKELLLDGGAGGYTDPAEATTKHNIL